MSEDVNTLVHRLEAALDNDQARIAIDELTGALSSLAVILRDDDIRSSMQGGPLPSLLMRTLDRPTPAEGNENAVHEQVGRVAANFGASNDANLDALLSVGYPQAVVERLADSQETTSVPAARALVASLLNGVASDHEPTKDVLVRPDRLSQLIRLAERYGSRDDGSAEAASLRLGIREWLWRIVEDLTEYRPSSLPESLVTAATLDAFFMPLRPFMPDAPLNVAAGGESEAQSSQMSVLEHCCTCLATMSEAGQQGSTADDADSSSAAFSHNHEALTTLLDFIEFGRIPSEWVFDDDETAASGNVDEAEAEEHEVDETDMSRENCEKRLGKAKASGVRMIIHTSWDIPYDPATAFWKRIIEWTAKGPEREDLVSCALLSIGNGAKNGEIAESLLHGPSSILSSLLPILSPSTIITTQHAVISLLRNLAIPPANKRLLGDAGVIGRILDMGVFGDTRDMVETVQGGSAVVLKLLCQGNGELHRPHSDSSEGIVETSSGANAEKFVQHVDAVSQVCAVITRVDTPAVAFEASRILANSIKSLTTDRNKHVEAVARLCQTDVVEVFVNLLRRSVKYPLLTNDAIIGLALVTTFGPEGSANIVRLQLEKERDGKDDERRSGKEVLAEIVSTGPEAFSNEIRSNTGTLLAQLAERTGRQLLESGQNPELQ